MTRVEQRQSLQEILREISIVPPVRAERLDDGDLVWLAHHLPTHPCTPCRQALRLLAALKPGLVSWQARREEVRS